jgi:predicted naringenin-chalcone synthase
VNPPISFPRLSVPVVVVPPRAIPHGELVDAVRQQYDAVFPANSPQRSVVARAVTMAGHLAIDTHPLHLTLSDILASNGLGTRNAAAWDAFYACAIPAADAALHHVGVTGPEIDVVIFESSTLIAMPSPITVLGKMLGLRPDCAAVPVFGMGCRGGAHAITVGYQWLRAHPRHKVLIVTADFASPHFHVEPDLRDTALVGSIVSSTLFSDAAAAAVMSTDLSAGIEILDTARYEVPGTPDAIEWVVTDEGPRFRLTSGAVRSIPALGPTLRGMLVGNGWESSQLAACALHVGGNAIIRDIQKTLGLTDHQIAPVWASLTRGNLMSSAVLDATSRIAANPEWHPPHGAPILGAGYGPGFGMDAFIGRAWLQSNDIRTEDNIGDSTTAAERRPRTTVG